MFPVRVNAPVEGSYNSALANGGKGNPPPAIRNLAAVE